MFHVISLLFISEFCTRLFNVNISPSSSSHAFSNRLLRLPLTFFIFPEFFFIRIIFMSKIVVTVVRSTVRLCRIIFNRSCCVLRFLTSHTHIPRFFPYFFLHSFTSFHPILLFSAFLFRILRLRYCIFLLFLFSVLLFYSNHFCLSFEHAFTRFLRSFHFFTN